jgi:hypothetical protein
MVFDLDRQNHSGFWTPLYAHEDANLAPPNWVAINPKTGNGHIGYELEVPVRMDDKSRKSARYLAAIECAYGHGLHADPAYSGHLCKNPLHEYWQTYWLTSRLYSLHALAEFDDLNQGLNYHKKNDQSECFPLGRNCQLFDAIRIWAYQSVRTYWGPGGYEHFYDALELKAKSLNIQLFPGLELPFAELKSIARSVSRWTWNNMTPSNFQDYVNATHSPDIQRIRGLKGNARSIVVRSAKAEECIQQAHRLAAQGFGVRAIARLMNKSVGSVSQWLRKEWRK